MKLIERFRILRNACGTSVSKRPYFKDGEATGWSWLWLRDKNGISSITPSYFLLEGNTSL